MDEDKLKKNKKYVIRCIRDQWQLGGTTRRISGDRVEGELRSIGLIDISY